MNNKVLLADDSLTIQKVIKITLANQPYDITDCSTEDELFHQLSTVSPKLVFLDFNLSEKYTGYELATKIKSICPSTKVLLLLGTFDTIDEDSMIKCGASDKIVKPFDSNKFIAICKKLIEEYSDEILPSSTPVVTKSSSSFQVENPEDQWTVSHSTEQKFDSSEKEIDISLPNIQNPLLKEMSDWGMSVPGVISPETENNFIADLPPVIGEVKSLNVHRAQKNEYLQKFPDNSDLDYPALDVAPSIEKNQKEKLSSKLISVESFNDKPLELEGPYVADETNISDIEAQIREEVEGNLWIADEFEELKKEVSNKIEEVKNNFHPNVNQFDESLFKPLDENEVVNWNETRDFVKENISKNSSIDMSDMKIELESMVKKYVKEYVDEMFKKNAEKIAWEVIPDLAENLIRQELSKISSKILSDHS